MMGMIRHCGEIATIFPIVNLLNYAVVRKAGQEKNNILFIEVDEFVVMKEKAFIPIYSLILVC